MARFLLFVVAAYGLWCATESAKLCVMGAECGHSVAGLCEEHASTNQIPKEIEGRRITEILPSGEEGREIMYFRLDYADPQPNKNTHPGNSAPHAPPIKHF
ncbi:hypothetical protein KI387_039209 [Taxus chinensis]|uniref:Secreted protein n=1 Tax=Taxus chinensis TaxID=29808 RepID=A0AA38CAE4_TAXCH|nr:hypothetical protein KI387_039209 [Taxus chinensis]